LLIACASGCGSKPAQKRELTAQELRGRDVFQANCAICHSAYKDEALQGPSLAGVFRKKELPGSGMPATDAHVEETIRMGRKNMPAFNTLLDDRQIADLVAFLHTL
jgi:mono/diheme cytochrome c family protein